MDKLKQLATDSTRQQNPSWSNIYNTDIRNLFPKYQLSKIQKSKIKYDKFRLMMENIQEFIYLEKHRKENKIQIGVIDGLKEQLEELEKQYQGKSQDKDKQKQEGSGSRVLNTKNYHIDIIKQRDITETIVSQLSKYAKEQSSKIGHKNQILAYTIKNNEKWNNYFITNTQKPASISQQQKFTDRIQLAQTAQIPNICDSLNNSTCSLILLERFKRNQVQKAILNKWKNNDSSGKENGNGNGDRKGNQNNGENQKQKQKQKQKEKQKDKEKQKEKQNDRELEIVGKEFGADWSQEIKDVDFNAYV